MRLYVREGPYSVSVPLAAGLHAMLLLGDQQSLLPARLALAARIGAALRLDRTPAGGGRLLHLLHPAPPRPADVCYYRRAWPGRACAT